MLSDFFTVYYGFEGGQSFLCMYLCYYNHVCLLISLLIQGKLHGYTEEEQVRNLFRAKLECEARIENATDLFPGKS